MSNDGLIVSIYKDALSPSVKITGETAGRLVKSILAPLRGLIWSFEQIEEKINEIISKKLIGHNEEDLNEQVSPEIVAPTMLALTYTYSNETLRDMFVNLLSKSMLKQYSATVHPSFVEVIKQMDTLDALLIKKLNYKKTTFPVIEPRIKVDDKYNYSGMPHWYLGYNFLGNIDPRNISISLERLKRLGLIDLSNEASLSDKTVYTNIIIEDDYIKSCLSQAIKTFPDAKYSPRNAFGIFTDYGVTFMQVCVDE